MTRAELIELIRKAEEFAALFPDRNRDAVAYGYIKGYLGLDTTSVAS